MDVTDEQRTAIKRFVPGQERRRLKRRRDPKSGSN
jgi:hypothetical protein